LGFYLHDNRYRINRHTRPLRKSSTPTVGLLDWTCQPPPLENVVRVIRTPPKEGGSKCEPVEKAVGRQPTACSSSSEEGKGNVVLRTSKVRTHPQMHYVTDGKHFRPLLFLCLSWQSTIRDQEFPSTAFHQVTTKSRSVSHLDLNQSKRRVLVKW